MLNPFYIGGPPTVSPACFDRFVFAYDTEAPLPEEVTAQTIFFPPGKQVVQNHFGRQKPGMPQGQTMEKINLGDMLSIFIGIRFTFPDPLAYRYLLKKILIFDIGWKKG